MLLVMLTRLILLIIELFIHNLAYSKIFGIIVIMRQSMNTYKTPVRNGKTDHAYNLTFLQGLVMKLPVVKR